MSNKNLTRLNFIDVARSYAIMLALFSHAMFVFGGFTALGEDALKIKLFTRTATPLFVFMFGMMLELVYARKARENGLSSVIRRLILRSAQCYLGYELTVVAGMISDNISLGEGANALLFLDNAMFGNILRLYSVVLLLAIPIIWIRCRAGTISLAIMLAVIWAGDLFLERYAGVSLGRFDTMIGIFLGTGSSLDGPSIWHGMTFVFAGMLVAASLHNWNEYGLKRFYSTLLALAIVSTIVIASLAADVSLTGVLKRFADYSYRSQNHIGYYAVGLLTSAITLFILSQIVPLYGNMPRWTHIPLAFSRSSLLSYSIGNIILSLLPITTVADSVSRAVLFSILLILVTMLVVNSRYLDIGYRRASQIRFEPGISKCL